MTCLKANLLGIFMTTFHIRHLKFLGFCDNMLSDSLASLPLFSPFLKTSRMQLCKEYQLFTSAITVVS